MSNSNQHIEEYLGWYLDPSKNKSPDFAVLITGGWGSGKTTFIKNYLHYKTPLIDHLTEMKTLVIYVSLFGVRNRSEIDERINDEVYPFFKKKSVQLAGKALWNVIKIAAMAKTGKEGIKTANESAEIAKDALKILKKAQLKSAAVVFDDVERADMPLPELLGYINEYVEHQHLPCIMIADEKVWKEAEELQKDNSTLHKFSSVKEKVVGRTLQVQTTLTEVLDQWLNPDSEEQSPFGDSLRKSLQPYRGTIEEVYDTVDCRNLRILKQSLDSWERLQNLVGTDLFENTTFRSVFFKTFMAMETWNRLGKMKADDLLTHTSDSLTMMLADHYLQDKAEEKPEKGPDSVTQLFGQFKLNLEHILPFHTWYNWLVCGLVDATETRKHIEQSTWFQVDVDRWLKDFYHWPQLEDQRFSAVLAEVIQKLSNQEITKPETLLLMFDRLLFMEKEGKPFSTVEFPEYNTDIPTTFKSLLRSLLQEQKLEAEYLQVDQFSDIDYWSKDDPKFKAFVRELSQTTKSLIACGETEKAKGLIALMKTDTPRAGQFIQLYNYGMIDHNFAALRFIKPAEFVEAYVQVENEHKELIHRAVDKRYSAVESQTFLLDEREFVEQVLAESQRRKNEDGFAPSVFKLRYLIESCERALMKLDAARKRVDMEEGEKVMEEMK